MTTLVVVQVDDFALRLETDESEAPAILLHYAEVIQERMNDPERKKRFAEAYWNTMIFGQGVMQEP